MIICGVVCPHPLLLLRELGGILDPVAELRPAALAALRLVAAGSDGAVPEELVLLGGSDAFRSSARVGAAAEPLSIRVGRRLLADAGLSLPVRPVVVSADASPDTAATLGRSLAEGPVPAALIVMADGSARRLPDGGPGTYDDRAEGFDSTIERALAAGDPSALAGLDPQLAEELMVAGRAGFQVLSGMAAPRRAAVSYAAAPYGVGYVVARWEW